MLTAPGSLRAGTNRIGAGLPCAAAAAARRPKASRIGMLWMEITRRRAHAAFLEEYGDEFADR